MGFTFYRGSGYTVRVAFLRGSEIRRRGLILFPERKRRVAGKMKKEFFTWQK
ncbi:hypothetical protein [Lachnoclostridium sp. An76]|uniref:hypothetical protein n=1 Tax=Lachnoclostridium sp. An76 TaxID=1965654 RepID=UPI0013A620F0|nr:hypothetical protein [Lachnoclostridium sp. An76]